MQATSGATVFAPLDTKSDTAQQAAEQPRRRVEFLDRMEHPMYTGMGMHLLDCVDENGHLDLTVHPDLLVAVNARFKEQEDWAVFDEAASLYGAKGLTRITLPDLDPELARDVVERGAKQLDHLTEITFVEPGRALEDTLGKLRASNAHGETVRVTVQRPQADPACLQPVSSLIGEYLGELPPIEIDSTPPPQKLWNKYRGRIAQPSLEEFVAACGQTTSRAIVGRPCWLGTETTLLQGMLLDFSRRCTHDQPPRPQVRIFFIKGDPEQVGCAPSDIRRLALGHSVVQFPLDDWNGRPPFWILRDELPQDGKMGPRSSMLLIRPLENVEEGDINTRVFHWTANACTPLILARDLDDQNVYCMWDSGGGTDFPRSEIYRPAPLETRTLPSEYRIANKFDVLRVRLGTVYCWENDPDSDVVAICQPGDHDCSDMRALSRGSFAQRTEISPQERAQLLPVHQQETHGWLYHLPKHPADFASDTKNLSPAQDDAPRLTRAEEDSLRRANHYDKLWIGPTAVYVDRQVDARTRVWTEETSDHLLSLTGQAEHPPKTNGLFYYTV